MSSLVPFSECTGLKLDSLASTYEPQWPKKPGYGKSRVSESTTNCGSLRPTSQTEHLNGLISVLWLYPLHSEPSFHRSPVRARELHQRIRARLHDSESFRTAAFVLSGLRGQSAGCKYTMPSSTRGTRNFTTADEGVWIFIALYTLSIHQHSEFDLTHWGASKGVQECINGFIFNSTVTAIIFSIFN